MESPDKDKSLAGPRKGAAERDSLLESDEVGAERERADAAAVASGVDMGRAIAREEQGESLLGKAPASGSSRRKAWLGRIKTWWRGGSPRR